MKTLPLLCLVSMLLCAGCDDRPPAPLDQADLPKFDFHTHYTYPRDYFADVLATWRLRAVLVDVAALDTAGATWAAMQAHRRAFPDRLLLCVALDATGIDDPAWARRTIARLDTALAAGAVMVKVWKDVGMTDRDASGRFIQIDDPRFQPVWDFLAERGMPVLAHIGEPTQAWLPIDPHNPHYRYYEEHPEYHAYRHPEIPRYETIMAARDRWLARNPRLLVVGAHLGSLGHDVAEIARRLDAYPNFYVDTSARYGDLAVQDRDRVRDFFVRYQDRILYGTDLGFWTPDTAMTPDDRQAERAAVEKELGLHWQYFTRSDSMLFDSGMISFPVPTRGLGLPRAVLEKVYHRNAERLLRVQPGA